MKQDEHNLQVAISTWLYLTQEFYYFAIPNGGLRHRSVAIKLKMEGVKSGVADMFWMISNDRWKGLFIEVKIEKGKQSSSQQAFEQIALAHGYYYAVVRSIDDCINVLNRFKSNQI
jgi:hypothetical protein